MIVKEYKSLMDYFVSKTEEERLLSKPVIRQDKFDEYLKVLKLVTEVFPEGKGKIIADNPETPYSYHCISVDIYDTDFEDDRLKKFAEMLGLLDGLSFFGMNPLNIVCQMEIYDQGA